MDTAPRLDDNALLVLRKRYLVKDSEGKLLETPEGMFRRVAGFIAWAEERYRAGNRDRVAGEFYRMLSNLEFLPNSPTLMNAGREMDQLAACFVLPVEDSLDSIFDAVKMTAKIHQSGGGTGFSFSKLRPKNDVVASTMGVASGPVSFIKIFNTATEVIKQGGTRRGANMGILRIDHPDIEEFVTVKKDPKELRNFNLSVAVTDAFMEAYQGDTDFPLVNPRTQQTVKKVRARDLFGLIAEAAWTSGEPGVLFIDTVNRHNPTPRIGDIEATNPCAEQPLLPYESCCLGSINLSRMVNNSQIRWERLRDLTHLGVRFLDDVIEMNRYPAPEIEQITRRNRKIGLGVMGFAHMLIRLGMPYDSPEALKVGGEVMRFIQAESKEASKILAEERGVFPNFRGSMWDAQGLPQRNATTTTIAPTGTLGLIADTSSGIEPIYDVAYVRIILGDIEVKIVDPLYEEIKGTGKERELRARLFRRAHEVAPIDHLRIQGVFQENVDNAVSKTINLPEHATVETVLNVYLAAYRMGLKGTTVFRDKSRDHQVLSCGEHHVC
ncbi:adenosylcobalamin-dependent ribonucleoside-diphosphate reductase [Syntrophorhabdus aromaticivorans]|uniref:Vitamin B12-dependent ribonucleotide reductase n=1 Tax=Syntrophorhabdus aromaticivorans TaxID=328301 RepID=A0A971M1D0_9BACT|nr:adenosylcobalamin-dependent ribonucleoside-diphosphate reductase [Syntrophorhabdus aromaticivorans]NLW34108.1 adenosylcobalamin-dependent ribonucleoside-diphosphate reductase [Syntrophorhabdus aromaticivorans]